MAHSPIVRAFAGCWTAVLLLAGLPGPPAWALESEQATPRGPDYCRISGIYPHLAVFNQPQDPADRPNHGECGIGAIAVWQDRLWYLTYPQHKTTGSNDKLYELDAAMNVRIRPESVGGTHAGRMYHRESNQLILGPYFIDARGVVRAADLNELRGRMTAVMRHLREPADKVYFFDMEGAIYEVDVHSLKAVKLFDKPVPGWHGKGGYTAQRRVVIANNGEVGPADAYRKLLVGGPAVGDEAGVLAEWDGETWRIVERKQFCDVTGPGGLWGSPDDLAPLWAVGWDKRSVILKLLDGGTWSTFRLPKGSHTFDPRHGWYTEWPRIREIAPGRLMLCMHGQMFEFPPNFASRSANGIRPICTHLRYIPDFCNWNDQVILGADDASMMQNPMCGQAQSNLWFGTADQLRTFGPASGWGGVWLDDAVRGDEPSEPFLFAGYRERTVHIVHDASVPVQFVLQTSDNPTAEWRTIRTLEVPSGGYACEVLPEDAPGEWIRVIASADCRATAYFHVASPRPDSPGEDELFAGLACVTEPAPVYGGIIRPAAHNRNLQWVTDEHAGPDGTARVYREVDITPRGEPTVLRPDEDRTAEVVAVGKIVSDYAVDDASVIVRNADGKTFRLPKGATAFDALVGRARGARECASERFLAHIHGTFYEVPRGGNGKPDWERMKPVASHDRRILDFCSWRGLLVLAGVREGAIPDGHVFRADGGPGLWFGALDDLWKLGKPRGQGGPWRETAVSAGKPSDPYLMTGFDRKTLTLAHDQPETVTFTLEINFDHQGFHDWQAIAVPPGRSVSYAFPKGYQAHWLRLRCDKDCRATAQLQYD